VDVDVVELDDAEVVVGVVDGVTGNAVAVAP
jgi:hypothetical protein